MYSYHKARVLVRLTVLFSFQMWACLFAVFDITQGNSGAAFSQCLILTSAVLWMPKLLHYGLSVIGWLTYLTLLFSVDIGSQAFYSETINSAFYLLIACMVIYVIDKFQYASFQAAQERIRARYEKIVFADANHFLAYIQELSDS